MIFLNPFFIATIVIPAMAADGTSNVTLTRGNRFTITITGSITGAAEGMSRYILQKLKKGMTNQRYNSGKVFVTGTSFLE